MIARNESSGAETTQRLVPMASALFVAGVALVILRALPFATRMPGFPSFWYSNQSLWIIVGFGLAASGWWFLWGPSPVPPLKWRPTLSGIRFRTAKLYIGTDCHLCEEAAEILEEYRLWLPAIEVIEVQSDPKLVDKFGKCVPVLVVDEKVRFRGRILEPLLRRLIEGTPPVT